MKKIPGRIAVIMMALMFASAGADELDGAIENCIGCHGDNGVSQWSDMPTIAGVDEFVHSDALYIYRDNERPCADSDYRQGDTSRTATNMCAVVADFSDETIEAVAAHFAALPFVPAKQEFDAALAAAGEAVHNEHCDRCHSDGGSNAEDEAGLLAGQQMGYMRTTFAQYASDEREQPNKMQQKMDQLSESDVEALVHFYASQQ